MRKYQLKELNKIIEYILWHRPDEFGLFLNDDGSLPIKELMWALHEEPGWRYVRPGHLKELAYSRLQLTFTVEETLIKPTTVPTHTAPAVNFPRLLFFAARRKAYPVILKHGLVPGARAYVPLATTEEMALRIGKRRDQKPVLLTVLATQARESKQQFLCCGELLYLVTTLSPDFLSGPPLLEAAERRKVPKKKSPPRAKESESRQMPGSFIFDPSRDLEPSRRERRKKQDEQKRQIRRERRRRKSGRDK
jgi:putative RNA 2'-phosphotransferase